MIRLFTFLIIPTSLLLGQTPGLIDAENKIKNSCKTKILEKENFYNNQRNNNWLSIGPKIIAKATYEATQMSSKVKDINNKKNNNWLSIGPKIIEKAKYEATQMLNKSKEVAPKIIKKATHDVTEMIKKERFYKRVRSQN